MLGLFGGLNGPWEIILILVVALLLFGKRLPEVARSLGKGIVEFKKGLKGVEDEVRNADASTPLPRPSNSSASRPPASPQPPAAAAPGAAKPESSLKDTTGAA
jgi:sec-independent protein translocase protein TatA